MFFDCVCALKPLLTTIDRFFYDRIAVRFSSHTFLVLLLSLSTNHCSTLRSSFS